MIIMISATIVMISTERVKEGEIGIFLLAVYSRLYMYITPGNCQFKLDPKTGRKSEVLTALRNFLSHWDTFTFSLAEALDYILIKIDQNK